MRAGRPGSAVSQGHKASTSSWSGSDTSDGLQGSLGPLGPLGPDGSDGVVGHSTGLVEAHSSSELVSTSEDAGIQFFNQNLHCKCTDTQFSVITVVAFTSDSIFIKFSLPNQMCFNAPGLGS